MEHAEAKMKFAILNFNDEIVSRHHTAAATLNRWKRPGSRYGWSIREVSEDGSLGKRVDTQDLESQANWDRRYADAE